MSSKLVPKFGLNEAWVVDENFVGSMVIFEFLSSVCFASLLYYAKHVEDTRYN
jgi:hypothetical protein